MTPEGVVTYLRNRAHPKPSLIPNSQIACVLLTKLSCIGQYNAMVCGVHICMTYNICSIAVNVIIYLRHTFQGLTEMSEFFLLLLETRSNSRI